MEDGKLAQLNHLWLQPKPRHLQIESGESLYQRRCTRCERDFVTLSATGTCFAVTLSAVSFLRLTDEVTQRWLAEECPGTRLSGDNLDRGKWIEELRVKPASSQGPASDRRWS